MNLLQRLIGLKEIVVSSYILIGNELTITIRSRKKYAICPCCGTKSYSVHSEYFRRLRDLPLSNFSVMLKLITRKFYCKDEFCTRKIFSEQPCDEITRYSRITSRTLAMLQQIFIDISARKGAKLSEVIRCPISASTALRMIYNMPDQAIATIVNLGVDDWAYRKGMSYGTVLIDMDTRKVVDLLEGRDGVALKTWLLNHLEVKNVSRDRSGSYSSAVTDVLPDATQIADRFHLVKNYYAAVCEEIRSHYSEIAEQLKSAIRCRDPEHKEQDNSSQSDINRNVKGRPGEHRIEKFNKIKALLKEGMSYRKIAKELNTSKQTIKKYEHINALPNKPIVVKNDYFSYFDVIENELNNGTDIKSIYRKIKKLGFRGSKSAFYEQYKTRPASKESIMRIISPKTISIYIGMEDLSKIKNEYKKNQMFKILDNNLYIQQMREQGLNFRKLLAEKDPENLEQWMEKTLEINKKKLNSFIKGLKQDIEAVTNAIISPLSNGMVEGHVNRLKNIKRQMYGRASIELLRKKVMLSRSG